MTINVPEGLPLLGRGMHVSPREGACIMEYISVIAGERFTDGPKCVHEYLSSAGRHTNDCTTSSKRQRLLEFIPRLMNTAQVDLETWSKSMRRLFYTEKRNFELWDPEFERDLPCSHVSYEPMDDCPACEAKSEMMLEKFTSLVTLFEKYAGLTPRPASADESQQWQQQYAARQRAMSA